MTRYGWLALVVAFVLVALVACSGAPVVTAVETLCVATSRPVISEAQRAAFKADEQTWTSLVDWLASFLRVRDQTCLKPVAG